MCMICLYQETGSRTLIGTSQLKVAILSSNPLKVKKSRVITALFHFFVVLKIQIKYGIMFLNHKRGF